MLVNFVNKTYICEKKAQLEGDNVCAKYHYGLVDINNLSISASPNFSIAYRLVKAAYVRLTCVLTSQSQTPPFVRGQILAIALVR